MKLKQSGCRYDMTQEYKNLQYCIVEFEKSRWWSGGCDRGIEVIVKLTKKSGVGAVGCEPRMKVVIKPKKVVGRVGVRGGGGVQWRRVKGLGSRDVNQELKVLLKEVVFNL